MADVGRFERDRPTVRAAAKPGGNSHGGNQPERARPVTGDVGDRRARHDGVVHGVTRSDDGGTRSERDEVDAVRDVEPLLVAETSVLSGAT